ncbi:MAG: hypothetical protein LUE20_02415 [Oscillospiraceae bacterium]|nr:hypothetical protein [Oscillospiraceae bacterium]
MNWSTFETHNESSESAFEMLCNQMFKNWCSSEYGTSIDSFYFVNGSGGDGGVESYVALNDGSIIGLQAKWFPYSISNSQINQIRKSIDTAMKIRSDIARYIVCIPRDLSSDTGKGQNTEAKRWDNLVNDMKNKYPRLEIELWSEARILHELQKETSAGIVKYWFNNSGLSDEVITSAFQKSKESWLKTKYFPGLNTFGEIYSNISLILGEYTQRQTLLNNVNNAIDLCNNFIVTTTSLLSLIKNEDYNLSKSLQEIVEEVDRLLTTCNSAKQKIENDSVLSTPIDDDVCQIDFDSIIDDINQSHWSSDRYFHTSDVIKYLRKLSSIDFYALIRDFNISLSLSPILFLGEPGTGKTHGVAATAEKLLVEKLHIPIIIRARNIPQESSWKDIIISTLGLSSNWSENEIWQALTSMAHRRRFLSRQVESEIKITPKILIIIDALDECLPYEKWLDRLQEASVISSQYPQIRFCFTSRPNVFSHIPDNIETVYISSYGEVPVYKLFDSYIRAYNIKAQDYNQIKFALTTPLSLRLFCELNSNKTVEFTNNFDVSLTGLLRKKIELIEEECSLKEGFAKENQYVLRSINALSAKFLYCPKIERSLLLNHITSELNIDKKSAEKLAEHMEIYGILASSCEYGRGLNPDKYFYTPGIQGYFDYAMATIILDNCQHPRYIDFTEYSNDQTESIYTLSILSMQKYNYLITLNPTISSVINDWELSAIKYFALRHTSHDSGKLYKDELFALMSENADNLITVTNKLVFPLSRDIGHPLGVSLLDEVLFSFAKPAQRDLLWSAHGYLANSVGAKWYTSKSLTLEGEFVLTKDDVSNGLASVYAWALSTVNNSTRQYCRNSLMKWAKSVPYEFYELFIKFSGVNDPQIKSDLFSILMCLVHSSADKELVKNASEWVIENILSPAKISENIDVSIRYYAIAILRKAVLIGIYSDEEVSSYMPPYFSDTYNLNLDENALSGTRMAGYHAIEYDLARYVLIDRFACGFTEYGYSDGDQFSKLIAKVVSDNPKYQNIKPEQFILAAAYAYIQQMGWNEQDFYSNDIDEKTGEPIYGLDIAISRRHYPATHGEKSKFMTVCEKYVWQFRNFMHGFLSDRLLFWNDGSPEYITDYGLLDNFAIPLQDIEQIDPDNISEDTPWHIPEPSVAIIDGDNDTCEKVIDSVLNSPSFDWEKWITIDNTGKQYKVNADLLLALSSYSCFCGTAGVETSIFINSVVVSDDNLQSFVSAICDNNSKFIQSSLPPEWDGGVDSYCYITPKEICWFPWKKHYDSREVENFPNLNLHSAVDHGLSHSFEYGEISYELPSLPIRSILNISDSIGYAYSDSAGNIKAEYFLTGGRWRTRQNHLLVGKDELLSSLKRDGKNLVWIMCEYRREDNKSREKYGNFYAEKDCSYVGYFSDDKFIAKLITSNTKSCKVSTDAKSSAL